MEIEATVYDKDLTSGDDPLGRIGFRVLDKFKELAKPYKDSDTYLMVKVHRAQNIAAADVSRDEETGETVRSSDPFVKLECCSKTLATQCVRKTLSPIFTEEPFWFQVHGQDEYNDQFNIEWEECLQKLPAYIPGVVPIYKTNADGEVVDPTPVRLSQEKLNLGVDGVKAVLRENFGLICDAFKFFSELESDDEEDEDVEDEAEGTEGGSDDLSTGSGDSDGEGSDDEEAESLAEAWASRRTSHPAWAVLGDQKFVDTTISPTEFVVFMERTKILDNQRVTRRTMKEVFRVVNTETEDDGTGLGGRFKVQGDSEFDRPEFMAAIVHLAGYKYELVGEGPQRDYAERLQRLLSECLHPTMYKPFRRDDKLNKTRPGVGPQVLRVSVWDKDDVGDDDFLGEVYINIDEVERGRVEWHPHEERQARAAARRLRKGIEYKFQRRPGLRDRTGGSVFVSTLLVKGSEMECFDNGFSQISWGGTFTLDFHPDMAEEHDPKDMRGELDLEIALSVPRSMILRESSWDERKRQEHEEKRNHMTLDIHACDSWCHKSYKLRIGNNNPDFKWLAMVTAQRYTKTFAPRGRLRMQEGGFGTTGKVAPYQVSTQLPPGMDRLQKEDDADVLHVGPETKLRDVLKDGDSAWVMFQNRKPHIVMAEFATLQHDQHEVDEARRWLKRLCREDEVKIQIAIAEKFAELQRTQGKTILQMFEDFDEDGGGTIDHEELRDGFDMLGIELSDKNFTKMLAIWDESGDGEIDYEEFAECLRRRSSCSSRIIVGV